MAKGIHTASKSRVRESKQANLGVVSAAYLRDYKLLILFSNNRMKVVDFTAAILKYAKGDYAVYADKAVFRKFKIEDKNIVWADNWDLIFPVEDIFNASL